MTTVDILSTVVIFFLDQLKASTKTTELYADVLKRRHKKRSKCLVLGKESLPKESLPKNSLPNFGHIRSQIYPIQTKTKNIQAQRQ
jgi:hypothetical protein